MVPPLHPRDQKVFAALTAVALVSMAWWYLARGGLTGGLVDIDRATPLDYAFVVDVNSAGWPELAQLPGIGEVLARRIVETRALNGPFSGADDLLRVPGIGPRKLAQMQRYLAPLPDEAAVVAY